MSTRKPLILTGARQVGKTWAIREFGKTQFKNVAHVFTLILGYCFLNETITISKVAVIVLIMVGVVVLAR